MGRVLPAIARFDVQAFGITDYFSADGYFAARDKYKERYRDSAKVFFPNVELRTNDVVNKEQEEVNIHLIFNPFRPDHADKIRSFLDSLKTNKTDSASRNMKATELRHENDYAAATTTRRLSNPHSKTLTARAPICSITFSSSPPRTMTASGLSAGGSVSFSSQTNWTSSAALFLAMPETSNTS